MKYSVKIGPEKRKDKNGILISKNVPLFADIKFSGTRVFYFTGYRIDVGWDDKGKNSKDSYWDSTNEKVRKNRIGHEGKQEVKDNIINDRLDAIKAELTLFFREKTSTTKPEIISLLDNTCKKAVKTIEPSDKSEFFTMFDKYATISKFSAERKRLVKSIKNQWERFEAKRGITITFETVTLDLLRDFENYLANESTKSKANNKPEEQIKSPKGRNTIHKIMALNRAFWKFAKIEFKQQGKNIHSPFGEDGYMVPEESYGDPIYITKEERNILYNAKLDSERLQRVRDIFVFQCLIGARVGDLCQLTKANVQDGILTYIARKTKDKKPVAVNVPLSKNALEILSRYDLPDGRLLPFITDQRYNTYLKDLFRKVEINRTVTRLNPTTSEPEQVKICDIISSHMARRAFIGNLYGKVDSGIIGSMSGHIKGSKAFTRYYGVSAELQKQAIDLID
jgi:integrase